ncbi:MAG TPA: hypothetical protein DDX91_03580 [Ruminococcaceae bacterium]|nr:hypothetical protein [Oscillospiraceae bacterium]
MTEIREENFESKSGAAEGFALKAAGEGEAQEALTAERSFDRVESLETISDKGGYSGKSFERNEDSEMSFDGGGDSGKKSDGGGDFGKKSDGGGDSGNMSGGAASEINPDGGEKGEEASLKEEVLRLREEIAARRTEYEAAIRELRIKGAVLERLYGEGAKNPLLLSRLMDTSEMDFDEKGELKGVDEQIERLKRSDGYLFGGSVSFECFRPEEGGDFSETCKENFSDMTYSQMLRALGK